MRRPPYPEVRHPHHMRRARPLPKGTVQRRCVKTAVKYRLKVERWCAVRGFAKLRSLLCLRDLALEGARTLYLPNTGSSVRPNHHLGHPTTTWEGCRHTSQGYGSV